MIINWSRKNSRARAEETMRFSSRAFNIFRESGRPVVHPMVQSCASTWNAMMIQQQHRFGSSSRSSFISALVTASTSPLPPQTPDSIQEQTYVDWLPSWLTSKRLLSSFVNRFETVTCSRGGLAIPQRHECFPYCSM
jgi:hypothetical protein